MPAGNVISTTLKRPLFSNIRLIAPATVTHYTTTTSRHSQQPSSWPKSACLALGSRKTQHVRGIISIPQIMFDPTVAHVSIPSQDGYLHRNIRASYPKNVQKTVAELNELFEDQVSKGVHLGWSLEPSCDAISRFLVISSREHVAALSKAVLTVGERLNHHPSITAHEGSAGNPAFVVLITCSTHRPAGLSVKDPRLAREIDEIARDFPASKNEVDIAASVSEPLRLWHWRENIGRAQPNLIVREQDSVEGEDFDDSLQTSHFWHLNNPEDVGIFSKQKAQAATSDVPTFRGLMH